MRAIVRGTHGVLRFDDELLSRHTLFLGGIGTGKTNAMMQLLAALRARSDPEDIFVVFDSKRDFLDEFYAEGDAVISNDPDEPRGSVLWNAFADVQAGDPRARGDDVYELASTIFAEELAASGENLFFAAGARDVFAAAFEALLRTAEAPTNRALREALDGSTRQLWDLITAHPDLVGGARYLSGSGTTPDSIRAFLQQSVNACFSGTFRRAGDFSVRRFVRSKGRRALFIEYDIAAGSRLTPVYRVLIDLAIKEALTLGRARQPGSVYFVMDEFALVPQLQHMSDGVNFGRSLGLKFLLGTQNVEQVLFGYGPELGRTILSGFGTVFGFRLMDNASRDLIRARFGANRKQLTTESPVRAQGVRQETVLGNVIEDWDLSGLGIGQAIASLPTGEPFRFEFSLYQQQQ
jgi:type IV secretory pathway TraG/TraD family ATPase VirD4